MFKKTNAQRTAVHQAQHAKRRPHAFRRMAAVLMAVLMIITILPVTTSADYALPDGWPKPAGQNGKLTWEYSNGILTISGNDAMTEFYVMGDSSDPGYNILTSAPWTSYRDKVTTVVIGDGVTSIGWYAFNCFSKLTTVYIGKGVVQIDPNAFCGCSSLANIYWAATKEEFNAAGVNIDTEAGTDEYTYFREQAAWTFGKSYSSNITYKIKFNANGGTGTMSTISCTYGKARTLTANAFKKSGYTFTGWNTKADGSGKSYSNKQSVSKLTSVNGKTITLYAQWSRTTYNIKFYGNGATSGSTTAIKAKTGVCYNLTANGFKRTGYTFTGWNTKADGSGTSYANKATVKNLSTTLNATVKLYAQWKLKSGYYTITYNLNGGTNSSSNPSVYSKSGSTITLSSPTRTGYTFAGWYKESTFKTKVTKITSGSTGSKTFYARWTTNKYTLKYSANGGTGSMSSRTCYYNKSYTLTSCAFTRSGYTFAGWNTKADGSGKTYANGATIKNLSSKSGASVTLYAQWTKIGIAAQYANILKLTCEPAYQWHNGNKPSYQTNSSGSKKWACQTTANGSLGYIIAYNPASSGTVLSKTYCRWNEPYLTMSSSHGATADYEYHKALANGTYDFKNDPAGIIIGWSMFDDETTEAEFEAMINRSVTTTVYKSVIAKYCYDATMTKGGSCVVIYTHTSKGTLTGRYAGSVYYNRSSKSMTYYLVGINSSCTDYGKTISGTLSYN